MTDPTIRYRRANRVLWRQCSDGVLLLPAGSRRPLSLSGSGLALWLLLDEPCTVDATASSLAERYDVDAGEIARTLGPVLDELVRLRVVEPVAG